MKKLFFLSTLLLVLSGPTIAQSMTVDSVSVITDPVTKAKSLRTSGYTLVVLGLTIDAVALISDMSTFSKHNILAPDKPSYTSPAVYLAGAAIAATGVVMAITGGSRLRNLKPKVQSMTAPLNEKHGVHTLSLTFSVPLAR